MAILLLSNNNTRMSHAWVCTHPNTGRLVSPESRDKLYAALVT